MRNTDLSRRELLWAGLAGLLAARGLRLPLAAAPGGEPLAGVEAELRQYLVDNLRMSAPEIDALVAGRLTDQRNRRYDPDLGYISAAGRYRHGLDGAICTYTYEANGARTMATFAQSPCRINTYGDSFTECAQVSDGETWQERLAAHLGEPVRNFGVGSYSVYQAFLRLVQKEAKFPAPYIVFNIFSEDHFRNLKPMVSPPFPRDRHAAPLGIRPFISANAAAREAVLHPNPCPTPESLHRLEDSRWLWRTLAGEDEIQLLFARSMALRHPPDKYLPMIRRIAARRRRGAAIAGRDGLLAAIDAMEMADALYSTMVVVGRLVKYAAANRRQVLLVLSQSEDRVRAALGGEKRFDQPFVDFLRARKIPFVDMLEIHRLDYARFKVAPGEYSSRFYVPSNDHYGPEVFGRYSGHYTPAGNAFQAFALKDPLVAMLDPKPPAYQPMRLGDIY